MWTRREKTLFFSGFPATPSHRGTSGRCNVQVLVMEHVQRGAVRDADHGAIGQPVNDQLVKMGFGGVIERTGRFIREQDVGPVQQGAGESQSLLLTR